VKCQVEHLQQQISRLPSNKAMEANSRQPAAHTWLGSCSSEPVRPPALSHRGCSELAPPSPLDCAWRVPEWKEIYSTRRITWAPAPLLCPSWLCDGLPHSVSA